ncbi:mucin-binding protein, partial [Fructobacillus cardui]|uniref:mucin-binding protein n=1 Tax=Fructobacillus cardui TaxID=2893170 RepID=UPI003BACE68B
MKYNKRFLNKKDDKRYLKKVKKNWVVVSIASFSFVFGAGLVINSVTENPVKASEVKPITETHNQIETRVTTRTINFINKNTKQEIDSVEPIKQNINWFRTNQIDDQGRIVTTGIWKAENQENEYATVNAEQLDLSNKGYVNPQYNSTHLNKIDTKIGSPNDSNESIMVMYTPSESNTLNKNSNQVKAPDGSPSEQVKTSATADLQQHKVNESEVMNSKQVDQSAIADSTILNRMSGNQPSQFKVEDPDYPVNMWVDSNSKYYSFVGLYDTQTGYRITLSMLRNGSNGSIRATIVDQYNNIVAQQDVAPYQNRTIYNPGIISLSFSIGLNNLGDHGVVTSGGGGNRYQVVYDASDPIQLKLAEKSFFVPQLIKQSVSYIDNDSGKEVVNQLGAPIGPIIQYGLTGQRYTTDANPRVISGQYLIGHYRVDPSNAQGTMSQFGIIGEKYIQEFPEQNIKNIYTQVKDDGTMLGVTYDNGSEVYRQTLAPGQVADNGYYQLSSGSTFYLRNPYVPQTRDIVYRYLSLGKFIPIDKQTGQPIEGGKYNKQYQNDPNDPSKAQNPVLPTIPGYGLVDANGNFLINPQTKKPYGVGDRYPVSDPNNLQQDTVLQYSKLQTVSVQYVDVDDAKVLDSDDVIYGWPNSAINYDSFSRVSYYQSKGYKLVSVANPTTGERFTGSQKDSRTYKIEFKHVYKRVTPDAPGVPGQPVDPNNPSGPKYPDGTDENSLKRTIQQVVSYVDEHGQEIHAPVSETITFSRDAEFDEVTGKVNYGVWHSDKAEFSAKQSPVINGYYLKDPSQKSVPAKQVTPDTADDNETIVYGKLGQLVPETLNHQPINDGQYNVGYPNDSNDPSKPSNPVIPDIPGYMPLDSNKQPLKPGDPYTIDSNNPSANTSIVYVNADQYINVEYIDSETNKQLKVDRLIGKPGTVSDYSTAGVISDLKKQGYVLVTDGYPKDGVKFGTDNQEQDYTVSLKHVYKRVTPDAPGVPGQPVDPNNPSGPKYPDGTDEN